MSILQSVILRGTRAAQPAPAAASVAALYYVTDEDKLERNSGSAWEKYASVSSGGGGGTVTIQQLMREETFTDETIFVPQVTTGGGGGGTSGALVFLDSKTASASATLDFTSGISSTYDNYQLRLTNLLAANSAVDIQLQYSTDGGSTWSSANCNHSIIFHGIADAAVGVLSASNQAQVPLATGVINSGIGVSGFVDLFDLPSATLEKSMRYLIALKQSTPKYFQFTGSGWFTITTAVNALRLKASAGNLTSGVARLYGISKT